MLLFDVSYVFICLESIAAKDSVVCAGRDGDCVFPVRCKNPSKLLLLLFHALSDLMMVSLGMQLGN